MSHVWVSRDPPYTLPLRITAGSGAHRTVQRDTRRRSPHFWKHPSSIGSRDEASVWTSGGALRFPGSVFAFDVCRILCLQTCVMMIRIVSEWKIRYLLSRFDLCLWCLQTFMIAHLHADDECSVWVNDWLFAFQVRCLPSIPAYFYAGIRVWWWWWGWQ